jgi:L-ascorbate metabolism protein UlaG (beta-lactamase superfamily)
MKKFAPFVILLLVVYLSKAQNKKLFKQYERDTIQTVNGPLVITCIGHGSLMLEAGGKVMHIDPVCMYANYALFPKADIVLLTHEHDDHLDSRALSLVTQPNTHTIASKSCIGRIFDVVFMRNGEETRLGDFNIKAVPAYNVVNMRGSIPYHPKGDGNGYLLTYGETILYFAGDTEDIPEMAELKNIDIAFLPMNLPYTMSPKMAANGARSFMPKILYPYHMGKTDPQLLVELLKGSGIEVRVRDLK